jgi:hypothetical protein
MNRLTKFFKELWRHTGFWANPHRYTLAEREARWQTYMEEVVLLAKEQKAYITMNYAENALKKMGCK